jgi:UrcA family protein
MTPISATDTPRTYVVRFADLDLSKVEGATALYARFRHAASVVCEPLESRDLALSEERRACIDSAIANAVVSVNRPLVPQYHQSRTGTEWHDRFHGGFHAGPPELPRTGNAQLEKIPEELAMARYANILETIGNTPLVKLNKLAPPGVNVYVKVESFNPMGSVKDRMARAIIERAEQTGALKPGQTVIEATSGNTGIGLAMVCAQKGYPLVVTMAESFSIERRKLLRFLGAKVVLTPASEKGSGMLAKAVELAEKHGWYLCRQFENEANADVHSRTTAREIIADFAGEQLDYFVSGFGTGGTLKGVARTLKKAMPATKIIAAEPDNSPVLGSGIPQRRRADGTPSESHPHFRPHLMQGWAPDFISRLTEDAVAAGYVDEIEPLTGRHEHRLHAARHRRALPVDAAVRGHRRGDDGGGACVVAVDAGVPFRCAGSGAAECRGGADRDRRRRGALRYRDHQR